MDFGRESFSRILSGESGGISFFCGVPGGNAGSSARAKAAADGMPQANPAVLVAFRNDRRFMRSRFMRSPETLVFPVREFQVVRVARILRSGFEECNQEQDSEEQVGSSKHQVCGMEAMLEVEDDQGCTVAELLKDRGDHHGAEAHGVASDYDEGELPCQAYADETIVESGVGDGRRILTGDCVEHEVERGEDKDAPDRCDPEDDFGEFHFLPRELNAPSGANGEKSKSPLLAKDARNGAPGSHSLISRHYSPPTVRPSMRIVGAATEPRNSRSLGISEMLKNISFRLPATVISSTG